MNLKELWARIELRRKAIGVSIHAASQLCGYDLRNIQRAVKKGEKVSVTTETLAKIAMGLQTSQPYLLAQTDDPRPLGFGGGPPSNLAFLEELESRLMRELEGVRTAMEVARRMQGPPQ